VGEKRDAKVLLRRINRRENGETLGDQANLTDTLMPSERFTRSRGD